MKESARKAEEKKLFQKILSTGFLPHGLCENTIGLLKAGSQLEEEGDSGRLRL